MKIAKKNRSVHALEYEEPEMATRGGEWKPQISFEIFGHCPKLKSQEANTNTVMTTTLEKGGCSLGTQAYRR
jgi:hypothetical protein